MFALHERVARVVVDVLERREVAGVGEGVVDDHLVVGLPQHVADVVRADEPGATGDEQLHRSLPPSSLNRGASRSFADTCDGSSGSIGQRPVDARAPGRAACTRRPAMPGRPLVVEAVQVLAAARRRWPGTRCRRPRARAPGRPGTSVGGDDLAVGAGVRPEVDVGGERLAGDDRDELHHLLGVHAPQRALARVGDVDLPPRPERRQAGRREGGLPVELAHRAALVGHLLHGEEQQPVDGGRARVEVDDLGHRVSPPRTRGSGGAARRSRSWPGRPPGRRRRPARAARRSVMNPSRWAAVSGEPMSRPLRRCCPATQVWASSSASNVPTSNHSVENGSWHTSSWPFCEVAVVDLADLELAAGARLDRAGHLHDAVVVEVEARDHEARRRVGRLLVHGDHLAAGVRARARRSAPGRAPTARTPPRPSGSCSCCSCSPRPTP